MWRYTAAAIRSGNRTITTLPTRMEFVSTKTAPPPAAPYSQATKANGVLYISGQVPLTPENKMVTGDIKVKAEQCFTNLAAILAAGGSAPDKVLKLGIYATDINNFAAINEVYVKFFNGHKPARTFIAAKQLPLNSDVEIEAIALCDGDNKL